MAELSSVANVDRLVPVEFINTKGNFVSDRFYDYLKPLIKGEVKLKIEDGFPIYPELQMVKIKNMVKQYGPHLYKKVACSCF